jgi:RHS repeat-associated protein
LGSRAQRDGLSVRADAGIYCSSSDRSDQLDQFDNAAFSEAVIAQELANYDPTTGTFLTRDPLDGVNGTTTVGNPYAYGYNDPLNMVDPTGMRPTDDALWGPGHRVRVSRTIALVPSQGPRRAFGGGGLRRASIATQIGPGDVGCGVLSCSGTTYCSVGLEYGFDLGVHERGDNRWDDLVVYGGVVCERQAFSDPLWIYVAVNAVWTDRSGIRGYAQDEASDSTWGDALGVEWRRECGSDEEYCIGRWEPELYVDVGNSGEGWLVASEGCEVRADDPTHVVCVVHGEPFRR